MKPLVLLVCCSAAMAQVGYERLRNAASEPQNWLTYNGSYAAPTTVNSIRSNPKTRRSFNWSGCGKREALKSSSPRPSSSTVSCTLPSRRIRLSLLTHALGASSGAISIRFRQSHTHVADA